VSSAAADPSPDDNVATVSTTVGGSADLAVTKALTGGGTVAGGPTTWTVTVTNSGPGAAADVVVVDALPAALLTVELTTSTGT
jgi:large repetitive protein